MNAKEFHERICKIKDELWELKDVKEEDIFPIDKCGDFLMGHFIMEAHERVMEIAREIEKKTGVIRNALPEGETQTCPKRMVEWGPWERKEELDAWVKRGDDRVCSFCGSIHPQELLKICKQVNGLNIFLERKGSQGPIQKIYIFRDDVANASEGAIKFYTIHLYSFPKEQLETATRKIEKALILSKAYEQERFQETRDMIQRLAKGKEEEEESEEEKIIKIVKLHRKPDGSFAFMDSINEIRRTFPILGLKGSKDALDKAKTEIWIREESLLKTTQKEEEKPPQ